MIVDLVALVADLTFLEVEEKTVPLGGGWLESWEVCFHLVWVIDTCGWSDTYSEEGSLLEAG